MIIMIAQISGAELWTSALIDIPGTCGSGNAVMSVIGLNMGPWDISAVLESEDEYDWTSEVCIQIETVIYKHHMIQEWDSNSNMLFRVGDSAFNSVV